MGFVTLHPLLQRSYVAMRWSEEVPRVAVATQPRIGAAPRESISLVEVHTEE
jgi:hypothetical protein